ncbi:MAG TPA: NUDIX domain-containing protein [Gemmatimonadales bacterium]|nr:NUDIX domain-containing protein [Gemmatimonadales bacterium]
MRTVAQVSAGGVAYRRRADGAIDVALVLVGAKRRWQLPKGIVDPGETPAATALREVREEAGIATELVAPLAPIEYWYVGAERGGGEQVRFHKRVHFYLLAYRAGDVRDHDREVLEARWVPLAEAEALLAFPSERRVVAEARALLQP